MSLRYKGAVISATPPTASTSGASGAWTLQQQMQNAGTWPFGGPFNYIEEVFSTYLYTGNGSTLAINNGIDLAGKGGLVWFKERVNASNHVLLDTLRGGDQRLQSNTTAAQATIANAITSFNSNGFTLGASGATNAVDSYVSWTFRKQPKFFDVVTYTGNGAARTISHNLGSTPGCIIIKCLNDTFDWIVWHRSFAANNYNAFLNTTDAAGAYGVSSSTAPTSTVFSLTTSPYTNSNGKTYVAYLFAHDAGGFGLSGSDNVISCGSFTASSGAATVTLGYEPQWVLYKRTDDVDNWKITDNMRGMFAPTTNGYLLYPNLSNAEAQAAGAPYATATGFSFDGVNNGPGSTSGTYIYIAIRRGPMKTPTSGTSVFSPNLTNSPTNTVVTTNFPIDLQLLGYPVDGGANYAFDRLRGVNTGVSFATAFPGLAPYSTAAESSSANWTRSWSNTGFSVSPNTNSVSAIQWNFLRAPGFFDEVCFTSAGVTATFNHNLGVTPELMIVKQRNSSSDWYVWSKSSPLSGQILYLDANLAWDNSPTVFNSTAPTASVFTFGTGLGSGNFVNYLFASCPGVSKVGSYTGTGATQTIDCGFTGGARFVIVKRTDLAGDWYVWDTARGMVAGTDPFLLLNSTSAEVNTNLIYTATGGFQIVSSASGVNASGGTYIFLAIA